MKDLISNSKLDSDEVPTCCRREYLHILWVHSKTSKIGETRIVSVCSSYVLGRGLAFQS